VGRIGHTSGFSLLLTGPASSDIQEPLQADVQGLVDAIVPAVLENWQEEDDRSVIRPIPSPSLSFGDDNNTQLILIGFARREKQSLQRKLSDSIPLASLDSH
jgi:hypothetical protein